MSPEDAPATNAVRDGIHSADVYRFPASAIFRRQPGDRGDQVVIVHRGECEIYESPAALARALLAGDGPSQARLAEADRLQAFARLEAADASQVRRAAAARWRQADDLLQFIGAASFCAAVFAALILAVIL